MYFDIYDELVRPSVSFYFLKLLLHHINQQIELLEFDLRCHVVLLKWFQTVSGDP